MCVLLAFGLLPWFGSLFLFFSIFSAYKNDQHISGIVIRRFTSGHFRNTSVKLEVEFKTTSKLENEIVDPGTPEMLFFLLPGPGDKVDILYNPNKPKEIFVNQFWALYPVPLILAMLGTLFLWLAGKQYAGIHQNVP
jgi:hypothetical protein